MRRLARSATSSSASAERKRMAGQPSLSARAAMSCQRPPMAGSRSSFSSSSGSERYRRRSCSCRDLHGVAAQQRVVGTGGGQGNRDLW